MKYTNDQKKHLLTILLGQIKKLQEELGPLDQKRVFETLDRYEWHFGLKKDSPEWVVIEIFKKDLLEADINMRWHGTWVRIPKEMVLRALFLDHLPFPHELNDQSD